MGILGVVAIGYIFYLIINLYNKVNVINYVHKEKIIILSCIMGLLVSIAALQMEGTFLRNYIWSSYAIILGFIRKLSK